MNILFVNNIPFNPIAGGIERVTDILAKELIRRGHFVYYLCGKVNTDCLDLLNYDFPATLYQFPENGLFHNEQNLRYYKQLQIDLSIDIIINQRGLRGVFNQMLTSSSAKLISVIHSVPDGFIDQKLNSLAESTQPPLVALKKFLKLSFPLFFKAYWERVYTKELKSKYEEMAFHSNAIVTLSKQDIEIINNYIPSEYSHKVYSIANPNSFNFSIPQQFLNKQKTILYVGRLDKFEKEPLRMLRIWNRIGNEWPDWQLKIVGDGPEKSTMEEYVKKHNLNNVHFEGQKKDVTLYYKEASFICLTSNFEGWGMALTEGMQFGCIPFTFKNYGAASDIIDDDINGCLIQPFNLKQYAKRLSKLMKDEAKRVAMSKAAVEKVEKFSSKNIADKWEQLFAEL